MKYIYWIFSQELHKKIFLDLCLDFLYKFMLLRSATNEIFAISRKKGYAKCIF